MESNSSIALDEPAYNPGLEEKIDTVIQYQNAQYGLSLFTIGVISAILVIYILYRFITHFFEF